MDTMQTIYEDTVGLLKTLDAGQLAAVHAVIVELSDKNRSWNSPLGIKTEVQLWDHIDRSLAQAKAGLGKDTDDLIQELMQEYDV